MTDKLLCSLRLVMQLWPRAPRSPPDCNAASDALDFQGNRGAVLVEETLGDLRKFASAA